MIAHRLSIIAGILFAATLTSPSWSAEVAPANPQPSATSPGLAVDYYFGDFSLIKSVVEWAAEKKAKPGEPLPNLSYRGGDGKKVFGTKHANFVATIITGYLRFPEAGGYVLRARSNDGIRVSVGGAQLIEVSKPHGDQDSEPANVNISEPGLYPIEVVWYERKGSYVLELSWSKGGGFEVIPPEYFSH